MGAFLSIFNVVDTVRVCCNRQGVVLALQELPPRFGGCLQDFSEMTDVPVFHNVKGEVPARLRRRAANDVRKVLWALPMLGSDSRLYGTVISTC